MIRKYNTQTGWLGRIQNDSEALTFRENEVKLQVIINAPPEYNSFNQRLERSEIVDVPNLEWRVEYTLIDLTEQELTDKRNAEAEANEQSVPTSLLRAVLRETIEDTPTEYPELFPYYRVGYAYPIDYIFNYENQLYRVVQAHTSQADWFPNLLPALYTPIAPPGTIAEWVQPLGAHDAYQTGDKVLHNGKTWESTIDNNVWEPGVHGWIEF